MEQHGNTGATPEDKGHERRTAARHSSTLKVTCYPSGGGVLERRTLPVRNVSKFGIGLISERSWPAGTTLILELPVEEDELKTLRLRVVHSTPQMSGRFLIGCTFENPLGETELQLLAR